MWSLDHWDLIHGLRRSVRAADDTATTVGLIRLIRTMATPAHQQYSLDVLVAAHCPDETRLRDAVDLLYGGQEFGTKGALKGWEPAEGSAWWMDPVSPSVHALLLVVPKQRLNDSKEFKSTGVELTRADGADVYYTKKSLQISPNLTNGWCTFDVQPWETAA